MVPRKRRRMTKRQRRKQANRQSAGGGGRAAGVGKEGRRRGEGGEKKEGAQRVVFLAHACTLCTCTCTRTREVSALRRVQVCASRLVQCRIYVQAYYLVWCRTRVQHTQYRTPCHGALQAGAPTWTDMRGPDGRKVPVHINAPVLYVRYSAACRCMYQYFTSDMTPCTGTHTSTLPWYSYTSDMTPCTGAY